MKTVWVIVIMVLVAAGLTLLLIYNAPEDGKSKGKGVGKGNENVNVEGDWTTTKSGLKYEDIKVGTGTAAEPGDKVVVHYTGTLTNGKKFDSSVDRGQPFAFDLGRGKVIRGWDEGVAGMKEGGRRRLWIPAELGYGARGAGADIPPNADLLFDVELLKVQ